MLSGAQHPLAGPRWQLLVKGWCSGFVFFHSFSRSCLFSLALVTGTIRKAQNLLKQYSQHGLDGKKGASNLIPMEGNHGSSYFTFELLCVISLAFPGGASISQVLGGQHHEYSYPWGTGEVLEGQMRSLNVVAKFPSLCRH